MRTVLLLAAGLCLTGCEAKPQNNPAPGGGPVAVAPPPLAPGEKPAPPFPTVAPAAPPKKQGKVNFETVEPDLLAQMARQKAGENDYPTASLFQHWYLLRTGDGYYDCACYFARVGKADEAFYCLVKGGLDEGFDLDHAQVDEDLTGLHADPRWGQLLPYLRQCSEYWGTQGKPVTTLVLPAGYAKAKGELWVVAWMHGMGSNPSGLVDPADKESLAQEMANKLNVAFVGVSGTKPRGRKSFVWAEDPDADFARVKAAVDEVRDRVTVRPAGVITFGFSQGALAGAEIAARHPDFFAGSIALSSGGLSEFKLASLTDPSPLLKKRGFVFGCGAKEHPGNVALTRHGADFTRQFGAATTLDLFPGQAAHSLPRDFDQKFPRWVKSIQAAQGK